MFQLNRKNRNTLRLLWLFLLLIWVGYMLVLSAGIPQHSSIDIQTQFAGLYLLAIVFGFVQFMLIHDGWFSGKNASATISLKRVFFWMMATVYAVILLIILFMFIL